MIWSRALLLRMFLKKKKTADPTCLWKFQSSPETPTKHLSPKRNFLGAAHSPFSIFHHKNSNMCLKVLWYWERAHGLKTTSSLFCSEESVCLPTDDVLNDVRQEHAQEHCRVPTRRPVAITFTICRHAGRGWQVRRLSALADTGKR